MQAVHEVHITPFLCGADEAQGPALLCTRPCLALQPKALSRELSRPAPKRSAATHSKQVRQMWMLDPAEPCKPPYCRPGPYNFCSGCCCATCCNSAGRVPSCPAEAGCCGASQWWPRKKTTLVQGCADLLPFSTAVYCALQPERSHGTKDSLRLVTQPRTAVRPAIAQAQTLQRPSNRSSQRLGMPANTVGAQADWGARPRPPVAEPGSKVRWHAS